MATAKDVLVAAKCDLYEAIKPHIWAYEQMTGLRVDEIQMVRPFQTVGQPHPEHTDIRVRTNANSL